MESRWLALSGDAGARPSPTPPPAFVQERVPPPARPPCHATSPARPTPLDRRRAGAWPEVLLRYTHSRMEVTGGADGDVAVAALLVAAGGDGGDPGGAAGLVEMDAARAAAKLASAGPSGLSGAHHTRSLNPFPRPPLAPPSRPRFVAEGGARCVPLRGRCA